MRNNVNRSLFSTLPVFLLCLTGLILSGQTQAPIQAIINREIELLQCYGGGSPLTAEERQQAAALVQTAMREAPDRWIAADAHDQKTIAQLATHDPVTVNSIREAARYHYAFQNTSDPAFQKEFLIEKQIIEAHDPVVVVDPAHQRLISEHMLISLRRAGTWIAASYKMEPPSPRFEAEMRDELHRQFSTLDPKIAEGLAHIERDEPWLPIYFNSLPQQTRVNFFTSNKQAVFGDLSNPHQEQWKLAEAAGMISAFAQKQAVNTAAGRMMGQHLLREQNMINGALGTAVRGYSPACNPTLSASARASNGCFVH